jgi:hypothetical protein
VGGGLSAVEARIGGPDVRLMEIWPRTAYPLPGRLEGSLWETHGSGANRRDDPQSGALVENQFQFRFYGVPVRTLAIMFPIGSSLVVEGDDV